MQGRCGERNDEDGLAAVSGGLTEGVIEGLGV